MKIINAGKGFVSQANTARQSCAFPGICVLPKGRWLCTCRAAPTKQGTVGQHVLLRWSDDQGQSWSDACEIGTPPDLNGTPGLFRAAYLTALGGEKILATLYWVDHSNPQRPFFNEQTQGLLDSRIMLAWSEDAGATWSAPRWVDTTPFNVPTPITGPTLALPDGRLACQFEINKPYESEEIWRHRSVLLFSADGGETWPDHVVVSHDPENRVFYWDQRPGVLPDGSILDLFWTYDNGASVYLNIHARASRDGGRSFSPLWDTGVPGQPAQPVGLSDGRIAMVYVDRSGPPVIKLRTSDDGGRSWPAAGELVLHGAATNTQSVLKQSMQDSWAEMGAFSVGLPAIALLADGDLLVVYYAGPHTDRTGIEWIRVRP